MMDPRGIGATEDDVRATLEADFTGPSRQAARRLLRRCASLPEPQRVQVAVLKLARGDIDSLGHFVARAVSDYRDVLYWAFYPDSD